MKQHTSSLALAAAVLLASLGPSQSAAQSAARITPNFKDADITQVIEAVSAATGKNIIIDPRVRAQVTMLSSTPMSPDAFYQAFLSLLQVHGFVAQQAGNVLKIVPEANARTAPGIDLPEHVSATSDEMVTQVIEVHNVSAAQMVPVLRPLIPQYGQLVAYPSSNMLIISDRANNVNRLIRIIRRIDTGSDNDVDVVRLENASANDIVRIVGALNQAQTAGDAGAPGVKIIADERSNSVLITGEKAQRLRAKALIAHLDTPLDNGGDTQVRYLRYADAEKIAAKLKEQATALSSGGGGAPAAAGAAAAAAAGGGVTIWADAPTNALIVTAPPKIMRSLMSVVDRLDIRRAQVLVEAIIVEVSADKSAELGVNWLVQGAKGSSNVPLGSFSSPVGGTTIVDLAAAAQNPATLTSTLLTGTTFGIGRLQATGINFAAMLRAIQGTATTNIIATPSIVTMDNQEAQIKVAQEVPFITGQYANTGAGGTNNGAVNPFQTIQREEVGTILKITPQINVDGTVLLKISQESSSLAASSSGAVDLITNKRTIDTTVQIEDGGTIVLGGLIQDTQTTGEQHVPFLGRIPIIGEAFRTRSSKKNKTNLMVFIQPRILRDGIEGTAETNSKYNYMREQQRTIGPHGEVLPLLPGVPRSMLPPLVEPPLRTPTPASTAPANAASTNVAPGAATPASAAPAAAPPAAATKPPGGSP